MFLSSPRALAFLVSIDIAAMEGGGGGGLFSLRVIQVDGLLGWSKVRWIFFKDTEKIVFLSFNLYFWSRFKTLVDNLR